MLTLNEKALALGLKSYDTSLPQPWVDALMEKIGWAKEFQDFNPYGQMVWCYDNSTFGYPVALTSLAARALTLSIVLLGL